VLNDNPDTDPSPATYLVVPDQHDVPIWIPTVLSDGPHPKRAWATIRITPILCDDPRTGATFRTQPSLRDLPASTRPARHSGPPHAGSFRRDKPWLTSPTRRTVPDLANATTHAPSSPSSATYWPSSHRKSARL